VIENLLSVSIATRRACHHQAAQVRFYLTIGLILSLNSTVALAKTAAYEAEWGRYLHAQRLVVLQDKRQMNIYCVGKGSPTVVLESGLGWSTVVWHAVQIRLAKSTRVCAYDRAGIGFSDPGPLPRTSSAIVADLEALIARAGIASPMVLVAHSSGSLDVRLFADRHPSEVIGMVLVDPSVERQEQRFDAVLPSHLEDDQQFVEKLKQCIGLLQAHALVEGSKEYGECVDQPNPAFPAVVNETLLAMQLRVSFQETCLSEYVSLLGTSSDELVREKRSYGDMPLIVLTAGGKRKTDDRSIKWQETWTQMHDELATLSSRGVHRVILGVGHLIQISEPEVVVSTVKEVIAQATRGRGK
jgi:pimeloyl-ACP methyl ester carboxylesterase